MDNENHDNKNEDETRRNMGDRPTEGRPTEDHSIEDGPPEELYNEVLEGFARLAAQAPDQIDSLREALQFRADFVVSNNPSFISGYQEATAEIDAFLSAIKTGEIDPQSFIQNDDSDEDMEDF